ncbi:hypothetical protein [Thiofilum flexile]|uniref:hypothetical protein n=1 Tax=Thiofilum flexile TaxID=125627 RepID=UPI00036E878C|nr:hypothetical protein [Thiofilum flexile]
MTYFMNGVMEVLNDPIALLVLVALGLFLGQQPTRVLKFTLPVFVLALLVGLMLVRARLFTANAGEASLALAGGMALSTVLYLKPPISISTMLALLSGLAVGVMVKPFLLPGFAGFKVYSTFAGVACSAALILVGVIAITVGLKRFWEGVLVRAVASWIVASALMVLVLAATKVLKL